MYKDIDRVTSGS